MYGPGYGPIPWRDVVAYAACAGFDAENTRVFLLIIEALDTVWMEWMLGADD